MISFTTTMWLCIWMGWSLATSPLVLAALVIMLLSNKPAKTASLFTLTWFVAQFVMFGVAIIIMHSLGSISFSGGHQKLIGLFAVAAGVIALIFAAISFRKDSKNPDPKNQQRTQSFFDMAEKADTREAVRLGVLASVLNVTNIPSWVAFGLFIERGGLTPFETFEIWIATTITSVSTFVVIIVIFLAAKEFLRKWLTRTKEFIIKHSSSLVPGILACIAVLLIYIGLRDLLS